MGVDIGPSGLPMFDLVSIRSARQATAHRLLLRAARLFSGFLAPDLGREEALEDAAMSLWYCPHRLHCSRVSAKSCVVVSRTPTATRRASVTAGVQGRGTFSASTCSQCGPLATDGNS